MSYQIVSDDQYDIRSFRWTYSSKLTRKTQTQQLTSPLCKKCTWVTPYGFWYFLIRWQQRNNLPQFSSFQLIEKEKTPRKLSSFTRLWPMSTTICVMYSLIGDCPTFLQLYNFNRLLCLGKLCTDKPSRSWPELCSFVYGCSHDQN